MFMILDLLIGILVVLVVITQLIYPILLNQSTFPIFNRTQNKLKQMIRSTNDIKEEQRLIKLLETKTKEIKNG